MRSRSAWRNSSALTGVSSSTVATVTPVNSGTIVGSDEDYELSRAAIRPQQTIAVADSIRHRILHEHKQSKPLSSPLPELSRVAATLTESSRSSDEMSTPVAGTPRGSVGEITQVPSPVHGSSALRLSTLV